MTLYQVYTKFMDSNVLPRIMNAGITRGTPTIIPKDKSIRLNDQLKTNLGIHEDKGHIAD